jgi:hypothetical protein
MACGPFVFLVCPLPKLQLYNTGDCKVTLLLELDAVVFVNRIVEPAQTLITPEAATGIVVKLVFVTTGV